MLGDLDHFKLINDTYGHILGDEVLREVARRLLGSVRSYDFVGRYGGEEFLVVLNNCAVEQAVDRAEEIRRAIGSSPVRTTHGPIPITMSLGVSVSRPSDTRPHEEILCEVDGALYAAKSAGRNCCRLGSASRV